MVRLSTTGNIFNVYYPIINQCCCRRDNIVQGRRKKMNGAEKQIALFAREIVLFLKLGDDYLLQLTYLMYLIIVHKPIW